MNETTTVAASSEASAAPSAPSSSAPERKRKKRKRHYLLGGDDFDANFVYVTGTLTSFEHTPHGAMLWLDDGTLPAPTEADADRPVFTSVLLFWVPASVLADTEKALLIDLTGKSRMLVQAQLRGVRKPHPTKPGRHLYDLQAFATRIERICVPPGER